MQCRDCSEDKICDICFANTLMGYYKFKVLSEGRYDYGKHGYDYDEEETNLRIRILMSAWQYENGYEPNLNDSEFDAMCARVDVKKKTSRPDLDIWFKENFNPDTGMWIHSFPEKDRLKKIHEMSELKLDTFIDYVKNNRNEK